MPKRSYNSTLRQENALLTRQAIAQAALKLFKQRGYRGASIDAIAEAASVAPETIYATFGNKREILNFLLTLSIGGDEKPIPVIDRPEHQMVLQETDARRLLSGFSAGMFRIMERAAPVFAILSEAAKTEPELEALQNRLRLERLENMRRIAVTIAHLAPLRVTELQAAENIWALTSPEMFLLLTGARGWNGEQYSAWLQDSLARLLLIE